MGMFDDVVVNAKAAANAFSKKAGNIYDISKLKFSASSIKGEISKKYTELGELIYAKENNKPVTDEAVKSKIQEITNLKADLAAVTELLAAAKNLMVCPVCSAVIANDSLFCNKCGTKIEPKKTEQSDNSEEAENAEQTESTEQTKSAGQTESD